MCGTSPVHPDTQCKFLWLHEPRAMPECTDVHARRAARAILWPWDNTLENKFIFYIQTLQMDLNDTPCSFVKYVVNISFIMNFGKL